MNKEALSEEKINNVFAKEVRLMADHDPKIAFRALVNAAYMIKPALVSSALTDEQQQRIKDIAHAAVDAFNNNEGFDLKSYTPTPPPPVMVTIPEVSASSSLLFRQSAQKTPETKRVKCGRCNGAGQCEILDRKHTYDGIYYSATSTTTH